MMEQRHAALGASSCKFSLGIIARKDRLLRSIGWLPDVS